MGDNQTSLINLLYSNLCIFAEKITSMFLRTTVTSWKNSVGHKMVSSNTEFFLNTHQMTNITVLTPTSSRMLFSDSIRDNRVNTGLLVCNSTVAQIRTAVDTPLPSKFLLLDIYPNNRTDKTPVTKSVQASDIVYAKANSTGDWIWIYYDSNDGEMVLAAVDLSMDEFGALISLSAPTGLAGNETTRDLTWTDNSSGEDGFEIWVSEDGGAYYLLDTVATDVVTYNDSTTTGEICLYKVRAYRGTDYSDFSNEITMDWSTYWETNLFDEVDLLLKFDSRSGSDLTDSVSAETATVLTPCYINSGGSSYILGATANTNERWFNGNNYTCYFQFRQVGEVTTTTYPIAKLGGGGVSGQRGMMFQVLSDNLRIYMADGTTRYYPVVVSGCDANLYDKGVFDVWMQVDFDSKLVNCKVYNSSGDQVGNTIAQDISGYAFNDNNNNAAWRFDSQKFIVYNFKKYSGLVTYANCKTDSYRTGLLMHYLSLYDAQDISGNGYDLSHQSVIAGDKVYYQMNSWLLDYGHDEFSTGWTGINRLVPRDTSGTSYTPSRAGGSIWIGSRLSFEGVGLEQLCNLRDCKIRFTNAFFDRSNATIWGAACRASSYYDASSTKDFHISELNQRTLYQWLNDGYRGRLYVKWESNSIERWDRRLLFNIYLYSTDHKAIENKNILRYTGDLFAVVGYADDAVEYDTDNYCKIGTLKSIKPMISLRLDDGLDDDYVSWRPYFNNLSIKPLLAIITSEVGNANYMTWDQIRTLANTDGWDIAYHGYQELDYNDNANCDILESDMLLGITEHAAQELPSDYCIPHRHASENIGYAYMAHKHGFEISNLYGITGTLEPNTANPQALDLYYLIGLAVDLAGEYDIDQANPVAEIAALEAQIDLCKSGDRWAILFAHQYTANLDTHLTTVINYAIAQGVDIVSIEDGIANCKYLET